jgi:branched-chain amino acid transport system substrate-binding protein
VCIEAAELPCDANSQCNTLFGDSYVCVGGAGAGSCVDTRSSECASIIWPKDAGGAEWDHDKVALLGSIMPLGELFREFESHENAIELAINDVNSTSTLPGERKIAWIACNSGGDPDLAVAAAKHLSTGIGVPAIVGPAFSESVLKVATEVTVAAGVFMITPTATSPSITTLDDNGLVWRPIPSDVYQANALVDWVVEVQDPPPDKVVFLAKRGAYGEGLLLAAQERLEQALPAGGFTPITYADPATLNEEAWLSELGGLIDAAAQEVPDTIIIAGTREAGEIVGSYVTDWSEVSVEQRPELPVFLVTHEAVSVLEQTLEAFDADPTTQMLLYEQLQGVAPILLDEENFQIYNGKYKVAFEHEDASTSSSLSYDAAVLTMLSMATIEAGVKIKGSSVAAGMKRLVNPTGEPISYGDEPAGASFIADARAILDQGGDVDLKGVSGTLDFNLDAGELRVDLNNWHLSEKTSGVPTDAVLDVARIYQLDDAPGERGVWTALE